MKRIGFFDSGVGGISVLHEGMKRIEEAEFLYYADTEHVPYGTKSRKEIAGYVDKAVEFLAEQGIDALVVACNTATSVSVRKLRSRYEFPVVGMEPAVKLALKQEKQKRILVTATDVTVHGEKLRLLLERWDKLGQADLLGLGGLVRFAEQNEFNGERVLSYLRSQLEGKNLEEYGAIVFGCTHFGYFRDSFEEIFPKGMRYVDGNEGTIRRLMDLLGILKAEEDDRKREGTAPDEETMNKRLRQNMTRVSYYESGREVTSPSGLAWIKELHSRLDRLSRAALEEDTQKQRLGAEVSLNAPGKNRPK